MEERERKSGGDAKISDDFAKELEEMEKLRGSAAAAGDAAAAQARGPEGSEGSPSNSEDSAPAEAAEEEMDMASALGRFGLGIIPIAARQLFRSAVVRRRK